jgi:hypothetical protein
MVIVIVGGGDVAMVLKVVTTFGGGSRMSTVNSISRIYKRKNNIPGAQDASASAS